MKQRRLSQFLLASMLLVGVLTPLLVAAAAPGTHKARVLRGADNRPVIRWVFRDADLNGCRTPAFTLRHLRSRFGDSVELVAVGIDVEEASARAFLRAQRLDVDFVSLSEPEYRAHFAQRPISGIVVLAGQRVLRTYPAGPNRRYPEFDQVSRWVEASLLPRVHGFTYSATTTPRRPS